MKKKLKLTKKTIKTLKLKLKKVSDRKAAPFLSMIDVDDPSNGSSC